MVANLITASRLALIGVFTYFSLRAAVQLAAATFTLAWSLDAIDGWVARRFHEETRFGYLFDKVVDRLLIIGGVLLLVRLDLVVEEALWLLAGNVAAIPALGIQAQEGRPITGLGRWGKVLTFVQGLAVIWLLLGWPAARPLIYAVACYGGLAGTVHLHRVVQKGWVSMVR